MVHTATFWKLGMACAVWAYLLLPPALLCCGCCSQAGAAGHADGNAHTQAAAAGPLSRLASSHASTAPAGASEVMQVGAAPRAPKRAVHSSGHKTVAEALRPVDKAQQQAHRQLRHCPALTGAGLRCRSHGGE